MAAGFRRLAGDGGLFGMDGNPPLSVAIFSPSYACLLYTSGIFGMLVAVPLSSVLYSLLRDSTNRRLARRGIPVPDGDPPSADDTP